MMKYTEILENEHFNRLASILRSSVFNRGWRAAHREVPVWSLLRDVNDVKNEGYFKKNRQEFVNRFMKLITAIVESDGRKYMTYSQEDLDWFIEAMDGDHALVIASMLMAWASAPDEMLTPVEVASATGTAESTWRNKAAWGEIPGAVKKGKQWLLPRSVLRSLGVEV